MKKNLQALLFILFLGNYCTAQHFQWAKSITGNTDPEKITDMTTDPSGNIISTGFFAGSVNFSPWAGATVLTSVNSSIPDAFIHKIDPKGNLLWVKRFGNGNQCQGDGIKTDAAGNIYVIGRFIGTVDFDPGPGSTLLSSKNPVKDDIFLVKLDAAGNFLWAIKRSSPGVGIGQGFNIPDVAVDNNGIYILCPHLNNAGECPYMPIEKITTAGTSVWEYKIEADAFTYADMKNGALAVDGSGNIIVGGTFSGKFLFNPASSTVTQSFIGYNAYVLKIDNSGNYISQRILYSVSGTGGASHVYDVATDATGDIFIAGYFTGVVDFDPGTTAQYDTASAYNSMYLLKLTSAGNYAWARNFPGTYATYISALATDAANDVYATGFFMGQVEFKSTPPVITKNSGNQFGADAFTMKLTSAGNLEWVKQMGGINDHDVSDAITLDNTGSVYTGGTFRMSANFNLDGAGYTLTAAGFSDAFICKIGQCLSSLDTSLVKNGNIFTANATGLNYQWINCADKTPVPGATGKTFTPSVNGNYALVVGQNGCSDTSSCYTVSGLGIDKATVNYTMEILPNPSHGIFTIKGINAGTTATVNITNTYGQQVNALQTATGENINIKMDAPAGVYFITVSTATFKQTEKIIVR